MMTMRCGRCGSGLRDEWTFCPACGAKRGGDPMDDFGRDLFSQVFGRMRKEIEGADKNFKDMEAIDLTPWFREMRKDENSARPQMKGFKINISTSPGMPPKINVKTLGGDDVRVIRSPSSGGEFERKTPVKEDAGKKRLHLPAFRKKMPAVMEEPKAEIRRLGNGISVEMDIPGVKSKEDIEVRELESSVEVRALAGDKAYFKILTKPGQFRMSGKSFADGKLMLTFS